jgi:hypothetical protein
MQLPCHLHVLWITPPSRSRLLMLMSVVSGLRRALPSTGEDGRPADAAHSLMAQHQDLRGLGCLQAREESDPGAELAESGTQGATSQTPIMPHRTGDATPTVSKERY